MNRGARHTTSISKRILRGVLRGLTLIVTIMTVVSMIVMTQGTKKNAEALIIQVCEKEKIRFDHELAILENSVTSMVDYIRDLEEGLEDPKEVLLPEFGDKVRDMTIGIANRTNGAMAVYFRYDPEQTGNGTQGFFWSRLNDNEEFSYEEPTDILQYDKTDTEHVGWFYQPKEKGTAMWMSPYYNKNLDVFMISYVVPYYTRSGEFLGVAGMDIDFHEIVKLTKESNLYRTGRIDLIDLSNYLIYSAAEDGTVKQESVSMQLYNYITTINRDGEILEVEGENGQVYLSRQAKISNGMRLVYYVQKSEVLEQRNSILFSSFLIIVLSLAICAFYLVRMTNRVVRPLQKLTRITGNYAKGDWSETFICDTGDEIQELSQSISVMAKTTKSYIDQINQMAMIDKLTGLKNRNNYLSYIQRYQQPEHTEYALAVMDLNFLKKTNDTYGHENGDKLIIQAGQYICRVFTHSPVFRIGGDEFVAILEGSDYRNRVQLCEQFASGLKELPPLVGDVQLSISLGMAEYPKDGTDYDSVFEAADQRMYSNKKELKGGRE